MARTKKCCLLSGAPIRMQTPPRIATTTWLFGHLNSCRPHGPQLRSAQLKRTNCESTNTHNKYTTSPPRAKSPPPAHTHSHSHYFELSILLHFAATFCLPDIQCENGYMCYALCDYNSTKINYTLFAHSTVFVFSFAIQNIILLFDLLKKSLTLA